MNNLIGIIVSTVYIALVLILSKFVSKKGEELSRKFVHIFLCNIWIIYLIFIDNIIVASILPALFVVINTLSYKFKLIKTMERENNDGFGTIYYAVSILITVLFSYYMKNPMLGTIGILVMGYGDGLAAIMGKSINSPKIKIGNATKSVAGSTTMFVVSAIISAIVLGVLGVEYFILKAILMAVISTVLETISIKGLDNITVPIGLMLITYIII